MIHSNIRNRSTFPAISQQFGSDLFPMFLFGQGHRDRVFGDWFSFEIFRPLWPPKTATKCILRLVSLQILIMKISSSSDLNRQGWMGVLDFIHYCISEEQNSWWFRSTSFLTGRVGDKELTKHSLFPYHIPPRWSSCVW